MGIFRRLKFLVCAAIGALLLVGCQGKSPGPLEGAWEWRVADDQEPLRMEFRNGEVRAWGGVESVDYKVRGNEVTMTYRENLLAGATMVYVVNGDTARSEQMVLKRVKK